MANLLACNVCGKTAPCGDSLKGPKEWLVIRFSDFHGDTAHVCSFDCGIAHLEKLSGIEQMESQDKNNLAFLFPAKVD